MKKIIPIVLTIILLTTLAFAVDTTGANAPEVYQGMYPIKYDEGGNVVFTTTSDEEWYNYAEGRWANAVTLDKRGQMNPSAATESNITGYYVWIPRYAYLIRTGYNTADTGRIDIRFLKGTTNTDGAGKTYASIGDLNNTTNDSQLITYIGDRQMEYLVHPGFKFDEELTGIWVGKYEASKGINREIEQVNSIPNAVLWNSIDITSSFEETRDMTTTSGKYDKYNLYGLPEEVNTHLIKSLEYGAVVYLDNSIYGDNTETEAYRVSGLDSVKEFIAGGLEGSVGALKDKYVDTYSKDESGNIVDLKGSAFLETSDGTNTWNGGTVTSIDETNGIIVKENAYGIVANDGLASEEIGYRVVLTKGISKNEIKEAYVGGRGSYWWVMDNGDVWAAGDNKFGQLGVGDTNYKYLPVKVKIGEKIDKIVTKTYYLNGMNATDNFVSAFYITESGGVYVSGYNKSGELTGYGNKTTATKITGLEGVEKIIYDDDNTYYITKDGKVYACGYNDNGKLGVGTTGAIRTAKQVTSLEGIAIKDIVIIAYSTYFIGENGEVYASGSNSKGQLGIGTESTANVTTATKITALDGKKVKAIRGDYQYTAFYITEDGEVYVSGYSDAGRLGVGSVATVVTATKLTDLEGIKIKDVVNIAYSTWYIGEDGGVYASGKNSSGQLGIGNTTNQLGVVKVPSLDGIKVKSIKVDNENKVFYLTENGEVYVSGKNITSCFGIGTQSTVSLATKVNYLNGVNILDIIIGGGNQLCTYYLSADGKVYVAGNNNYGRLGVGTYDQVNQVNVVQKIDYLDDLHIAKIINYENSTFYITDKNEVYVSGYNKNGELFLEHKDNVGIPEKSGFLTKIGLDEIVVRGVGTSNSKEIKEYISKNNSIYIGNKLVDTKETKAFDVEIEKMYSTSVYQGKDGDIYNDGSIVEGLENIKIKDVIDGQYYLTEDGKVYVIGSNTNGKLGLGHTNTVSIPTQITALNGVVVKQIISSSNSTWYLTQNGEVYVSGYNYNGLFGVNTSDNVTTATKVSALAGKVVIEIISSNYNTWYLTEDGSVYACGRNLDGVLGVGTTSKTIKATQVKGIEGLVVKKIVTDKFSTYYIIKDGSVYASGNNGCGQLGIGSTTDASKATKVKGLDGVKIKDITAVMTNNSFDQGVTYFITEEGKVYASGYNTKGLLAVGSSSTKINTPTLITSLGEEKISQVIVVGGSSPYAYYLTEEGKVYVSGGYSVLVEESVYDAIPVTALESVVVKEIVNPQSFSTTWFITEDGEVYVCGNSQKGQLGVGTTSWVNTVKQITTLNNVKVKEITLDTTASYYSPIYYLAEDGDVYVSGYNNNGQLGVGNTTDVTTAKKITLLGDAPVKKIVYDSNNEVAYYLTETGKICISGGDKLVPSVLTLEDNQNAIPNVSAIYGNDESTVIVDTAGNTYVSGDNTNNKLGVTGKIDVATKISLKNIKDVGIGSTFSVFLKEDGSIVGYGDSSKNGNGLTNIAQIAVGKNHAVFLNKNGGITNQGITTSAFVSGISGIYKIVAGDNHTVALMKDGTTKSFGQADSNLTNVIDIFAGKNMTVFVTNDNKTYLMEDSTLTELSIKNIVYAELNAREPYFIDYERNMIDQYGAAVKVDKTALTWIRDIKGNIILTERDKIYNLNNIARYPKVIRGTAITLASAIRGYLEDYKIYGNSVQNGTPTPANPVTINSVGDLVTEGENIGKYKVSVVESGKNLINMSNQELDLGAAENYYLLPTGYILKENTSYTLSFTAELISTTRLIYYGVTPGLYFSEYDEFYELDVTTEDYLSVLGTDNIAVKFTVPEGLGEYELYILIEGLWSYYTDEDILKMTNVQLETGSTATTYQPYTDEKIVTDIFINEPLRKVGDAADYIDFRKNS